MIIMDSYLQKVQGLKGEDFNSCNCVSCGEAFNKETQPTELFFSHGSRVILLCPECKNKLKDLLNDEKET